MKTKNPFFVECYNKLWCNNHSRFNSSVWSEAFTGKVIGKLPENKTDLYATAFTEGLVITFILTPFVKYSKKHRVFVFCGKCKKRVPAGRIHQHKC
jgi:hypothetical protein